MWIDVTCWYKLSKIVKYFAPSIGATVTMFAFKTVIWKLNYSENDAGSDIIDPFLLMKISNCRCANWGHKTKINRDQPRSIKNFQDQP